MPPSLQTTIGTPAATPAPRRRLPQELSILLVLIGIALCFEVLGWIVRDRSFLYNPQGLLITILQVSEVGLLAIGVTLVIIAGGIDLSSGSVVALSAMVAASLAQMPDVANAVYPSLADLPAVVPIAAGLIVGALAGLVNGALIVTTGIPAFIVTLGMMVSARGLARFYTHGQPVSMLTDSYLWLGSGAKPVVVFLGAALVFHVVLRYTRFGKCIYAIGGNPVAARVSGINLNGTLVMVYTLAGLLAGLGGVIASSRAQTGQSGMGMSYELDAIAAAVIGGTSLSGGVGRVTGTVIGALILGIISSGFTFLGVDAYIQEIIKGAIIVVAVVADRFRKRKRG
ncbi:ABC transporter permease [Ralstonia solanacearum]|uniref:L-arabinose transporter permease protein n=1 Tax=Ralstonia solanacearum (strain Po82) TaxID=1031711 RepID=F6G262_RALS8|nr:ABC transporter permease [Ralstonia solanacearum]AEG69417.1 L-arabinose transporter permease protein [Ralstonia solanacearum Po82]AMP70301.1 ABC transporter [Ralstonia solanacearum]AMP75468.1 ABC transporter [Ralstonia solanacearum]AYB60921.1 ABC transporter permease [Ralstonia solanacearum]EUJ14502.1 RbsC [Ralstonia solanacearum P673]